MRKSEQLWLEAVHNDYDSFISSFHDRYTTNDYSVVWKETLPCPPNAPYDRMDRWELTLFNLNRTVELQSNLRIRNKYFGHLNETVSCEMYDEVKFEIMDESIHCHHLYCENNAKKIDNDSFYEEDDTPSTKHLAIGNSYLEHLLICDFLRDEACFLWEGKKKVMAYQDFKELWVEFEKAKPNCSLPDYQDYLESENMFEDYLDIFRGQNTRSKRSNGLTGWYYEHPFFDGEKPKLENKPCIKYVMIGEARPKSNSVKVNSCGADKNNTYFYNVNHVKRTNWLEAPFQALYPKLIWKNPTCAKDKINVLLQLASAGYVLVDLFPFAINYKRNVRDRLNKKGVTHYFFNHYLTPKLNQIVHIQNQCQGEKQEPRIAFSGPATTHHFLIHEIIHGRLNLPNGYAMFRTANHFGVAAPPIPVALPKKIIPWIPIANQLNGNYANVNFNYAPFYRVGCWDGSFVSGPKSLFIRNAFDLR